MPFWRVDERLWRHAIQAGMRPDSVAVGPPGVDDRPSVDKVAEQVLVEAFVRGTGR